MLCLYSCSPRAFWVSGCTKLCCKSVARTALQLLQPTISVGQIAVEALGTSRVEWCHLPHRDKAARRQTGGPDDFIEAMFCRHARTTAGGLRELFKLSYAVAVMVV